MEEEWDFRVEQHKELWTTLLPLEKVGGWEIVYAGD